MNIFHPAKLLDNLAENALAQGRIGRACLFTAQAEYNRSGLHWRDVDMHGARKALREANYKAEQAELDYRYNAHGSKAVHYYGEQRRANAALWDAFHYLEAVYRASALYASPQEAEEAAYIYLRGL